MLADKRFGLGDDGELKAQIFNFVLKFVRIPKAQM